MAPSGTATAAPSRRHAAPTHGSPDTSRRWGRGAADGVGATTPAIRRVPLRIVPSRRRHRSGSGAGAGHWRAGAKSSRTLTVVSVCLVLGALLAVVVGQALLANGQVRLSALQQQLSLEQSGHRQSELAVAELETPARIVAAAAGQLGMVRPTSVIELPYVSLSTPLPTPKVTPAPESPPAPATSGSATGGGASSGGSGAAPAAASGSSGTSATTATSTP